MKPFLLVLTLLVAASISHAQSNKKEIPVCKFAVQNPSVEVISPPPFLGDNKSDCYNACDKGAARAEAWKKVANREQYTECHELDAGVTDLGSNDCARNYERKTVCHWQVICTKKIPHYLSERQVHAQECSNIDVCLQDALNSSNESLRFLKKLRFIKVAEKCGN